MSEIIDRKDIIDDFENTLVSEDEIEGYSDDSTENESTNNSLIVDKVDPTIETLKQKYDRGKIDLRPGYQRKFVMKKTVASRLIESIILGIPIPVIYFAEVDNGVWEVIDGQQRLTAIFSYISNKFITDNSDFKLSGLNVLTKLNGKFYKDLSDEYQEKILGTAIRSIVIKKESDSNVKFEVFQRLNTGSTALNEDEIRNNVYRGKFIDMLAELENDTTFDKLVNKPNFKNRMIYRGMILRFFAFYEKSYTNYKPSMKNFCNNYLSDFQNLSDKKKDLYKKVFKDAISCVNSAFGENAFRRLTRINDDKNDFQWAKTRINLALFDVQMIGFTKYPKEQIYSHLDEIREEMYNLMTDEKFVESIEMQTSNKDMVERRFKIWLDKLDEIMKDEDPDNPRCFPYSVKEELFEKDPTCALCKNKILSIDDAHVDHIKPYSKDGKTIIENAQLAHRYCNQHKSNNV